MLARFSTILVGMILTPFVLHKLGHDLYGVVVAVGSIYEYLSLLRGGIGGALRRYVTLHYHAGRQEMARDFYAAGFWWSGILRTVVLLVGLSLAPLVGRFFRIDEVLRPDVAAGVALVLLAAVIADLSTFFNIPIYATGRTAWISAVSGASGWWRLALTFLALSLFVPTLRLYGGTLVVTEFLSLLVLMALARRLGIAGAIIPRPQLGSRALRRELFSYSGLALLSQAAALLYVSTDNLFIGRLYGAAAVTHYSLGTRWTPLVLGFLVATMSGITPIFTALEARGESARGRDAVLRVVRLTTALSVPACLVPCVLGDLFLVHWVGPEYRDSFRYLLVMLIPATLDGALEPVWMALIARGRIGWVASGDIIVAVGNVAISLVLALGFHLGMLGFAMGNALATLAKNLLLRPLAGRRDPTMPAMRDCLSPLPRALLGAAPGLALLYLARPLYGASLLGVVIAGLVGAGVCLAGTLMTTVGAAELRRIRKLIPLRRLR